LTDGTKLEDVLGAPLPFLLKILSAGKALSIQCHPDKANAVRAALEWWPKKKEAKKKRLNSFSLVFELFF